MTEGARVGGRAPVRLLDLNHIEEAATLMSLAFFDYPMWRWVMPDDEHRRRALPVSARASLRWGLIFRETYVVGDPMRGVAIWVPPGMADADVDPDGTKTGWSAVETAIGPDGVRRFEAMIEVQRPCRDRLIPPDGWYLAWLGVDPSSQRSGSGAALLTHMLARLDARGASAYLETEKADNVPYYQRHGFEVVHQGVLPEDGPGFWCLLRPPAS